MPKMKLVHVQVFFRHGARTPLHHVRSPNVNDAFWTPELSDDLPHTVFPLKLVDICTNDRVNLTDVHTLPRPTKLPGGLLTGQLVTAGQKDAFDLGRRLKKVYMQQNNFIEERIPNDDIFCRSTRILRTVISMRCVLAGLFDGCLSMQHNKNDLEMPVYVETLEREFLFPNHDTCPRIKQFGEDGAEERDTSKPHLELKMRLKKILGVDPLLDDFRPRSTDCPVYFVRDDYLARKSVGFPLPPGMEELIPTIDQLSCEELFWELLGRRCEWEENLFISIGQVLNMILCNLKNYDRVSKFHLYSCHDSTLLLLLYALGCFDGYWPPYCADLTIELYEDEKTQKSPSNGEITTESSHSYENLWIRVLYLGKVQPLGCLWKLPYSDPERYNAGYIPLQSLIDRWAAAADSTKA